MYYGHYFRLDTDIANIERGVAVFRYRPDALTDSDIYVSFSNDEIEFNHVGTAPDGKSVSALLLNIPVDESLEHSFAKIVTEAYAWKVGGRTENLRDLTRRSYHSTFYFGVTSKHASARKKTRAADGHDPAAIPWPLPARKLILDFLFDLNETRVFQMSPHCDELVEKLRQNFFARCLVAKACYWYRRAFYRDIVRESRAADGDAKTGKKRRQFYGKLMFEAEKEWVECVRDPRADRVFHDEVYDWFDDCELELRRVYKSQPRVIFGDEVLTDAKRECDKLSSRWLVARYSGLAAWRIFLGGKGTFFGLHLFWPRILISVAIAWFTLVFIETANFATTEQDGPLRDGTSAHTLGVLLFVMTFFISWIAIRKVVPLTKYIWVKALLLTGLVILFSYLVGLVMNLITDVHMRPVEHLGWCFWSASAFIGLVLQIFLQGDNPSESI